MQSRKLNIALVVSCAVLLVFVSIQAYLTSTETTENLLTIGEVDITLEETNWEEGHIIVPDSEVPKNPTITNVGKNEAYLFAKITVPCVIGVDVDYSDTADGHYQGQKMPDSSGAVPLFKFGVYETDENGQIKKDSNNAPIAVYDATGTNAQLVNDGWTLVEGYPVLNTDLTLTYVYAYADKITDLTKPEGYYYSLKAMPVDDGTGNGKTAPVFDTIKVINFTNRFVSGERTVNVDAFGIQSEFLQNLGETDLKGVWELLESELKEGDAD